MEIPAVSVIIPLYNAEKYIGECLDSILAQTFTDFEVIVVDDCSTDNSVTVVKSYAEKFGGRLTLAKLIKKSGGGGSLPRNMGVELSRGKYIYFMDSDDAVTSTALEELYKIAEDFAADVVHCEKFYHVPNSIWYDEKSRANLKPDNYFTEGRLNVTAPTVLSNDIVKRVRIFADKKLIWNYWAQLIRRNFIVENSIKLPDAAAQDMIWTICGLCSAKKYVIVPNVIYYYRVRENSVTTEKINYVTRMHKWITVIKSGVKYLDEFFSTREKLSARPDLKYILFDAFIKQMIEGMDSVYKKIPAYALDEVLRKEFGDGDNVALESFVFSAMNVYRLQLKNAQKQFRNLNRFAAQAQRRIAELEA